MDIAERLLAIDDIRQLKARYFRCMDTKDWAGLRATFCDDAEFDARAAQVLDPAEAADGWIHRGGDAIAAFIRDTAGPLRTVHHGHAHEVELTSPTEARGVVAMEDRLWVAETGAMLLHGCGHYHESYRRDHGAWRVLASRLTRLYVAMDARVEPEQER